MSENPKQKLIQESLRTRNSYCGVYGWKYRCNQIRMAQDSQTKHEINFQKNTFLSNSHDSHHMDTHDPVWGYAAWPPVGGGVGKAMSPGGSWESSCHPVTLSSWHRLKPNIHWPDFFPSLLPSLIHVHTHTQHGSPTFNLPEFKIKHAGCQGTTP